MIFFLSNFDIGVVFLYQVMSTRDHWKVVRDDGSRPTFL